MTVAAAFAPSDAGFVADPYPAYAALRAAGRVLYDQRSDHWLVPHHADVAALLRDRRFGRTYLHVATHAEMGRPEEARAAWGMASQLSPNASLSIIRQRLPYQRPADLDRFLTAVQKAGLQ